MSEENENAFKHIYGKDLLESMSSALVEVYPDFSKKQFLLLFKKLSKLEMKPRVRLIRDELKLLLPDSYPKALKILLASQKKGNLSGFSLWPYTEFIQEFGLEYQKESLNALKEITKHFTSEWGVRPFLRLYPKETLIFLEECSKDKNVHVRRWASEGARPRLPWGERLHLFIQKPKSTLKILENLKFDDELYVRKSVANHLNDITKDHPELVIQTLKAWKKKAKSDDDKTKLDWVIKHSLRTLIKNGHKGALELIGVSHDIEVKFSGFKLASEKINMGDKIDFSFDLVSQSKKKQKIVIDYIIHFVKANKSTAPKVFKLKNIELSSGESITISKSHAIRPITTRVYYAGEHFVEIQVNGKTYGKLAWNLLL